MWSFCKKYQGKNIGVLYGPLSHEDKRYIETAPKNDSSGSAIIKALNDLGFSATIIDPTKDGFLEAAKGCFIVFNNLHGEFGEDGAIQSFLKYYNIRYTGSYILANCVCLNKEICKLVAKGLNILTPDYRVINNNVSVHPPCLYPGSEAILAAISADETSALPGGSERLRLDEASSRFLMEIAF